MKITKRQLKRIIGEELTYAVEEQKFNLFIERYYNNLRGFENEKVYDKDFLLYEKSIYENDRVLLSEKRWANTALDAAASAADIGGAIAGGIAGGAAGTAAAPVAGTAAGAASGTAAGATVGHLVSVPLSALSMILYAEDECYFDALLAAAALAPVPEAAAGASTARVAFRSFIKAMKSSGVSGTVKKAGAAAAVKGVAKGVAKAAAALWDALAWVLKHAQSGIERTLEMVKEITDKISDKVGGLNKGLKYALAAVTPVYTVAYLLAKKVAEKKDVITKMYDEFSNWMYNHDATDFVDSPEFNKFFDCPDSAKKKNNNFVKQAGVIGKLVKKEDDDTPRLAKVMDGPDAAEEVGDTINEVYCRWSKLLKGNTV
jgi:hypothetical protein